MSRHEAVSGSGVNQGDESMILHRDG
jgi:hypothetical protein